MTSAPESTDPSGFVHRRLPTILLALMMFCTGACGFVAECLLSTVSTYILGNSIEQFSVIIALMMLMMGVGGVLQRFLSDDYLIEKFILAEITLALLGGFAPIGIYAAFVGLENHFELILYSCASAIGLLIGLELPLALRINERYSSELSGNIAPIFALDYIGSFIGALLWTKYLLKTFPLTEIGFLLGGVNLLVAAISFGYFAWQGRVKRFAGLTVILLLAFGVLFYGYQSNRNWSVSIEQRLYEDPITFSQTTHYQRIVLTHARDIDEYRLYLNGNLQFSSLDERRYHELLVHPAMNAVPRRERVLILGGGDGLALREVLKYPDVRHITLVDLDPGMIQLASTNPKLRELNGDAFQDARVRANLPTPARSSGRTQPVYQETGEYIRDKKGRLRKEFQLVAEVDVFTVDADLFLNHTREKWDVILVDLPDPNSIELAKLYSREFYRKTRRILAPGGLVTVQATSPYHAKEAFLCLRRTIESAGLVTMPLHTNVPSFGDWGWLIAWNQENQTLPRQLKSLDKIDVPTQYLTPELFRAAQIFGKGELTSDKTDVSTLMQPVIFDYYVQAGWKVE